MEAMTALQWLLGTLGNWFVGTKIKESVHKDSIIWWLTILSVVAQTGVSFARDGSAPHGAMIGAGTAGLAVFLNELLKHLPGIKLLFTGKV